MVLRRRPLCFVVAMHIGATTSSSGDQQAPATPSTFIDTKQLLRQVPFCRRTLKELRDQGLIPWIKAGGRVLFHWPSVEAALLRIQRGGRL